MAIGALTNSITTLLWLVSNVYQTTQISVLLSRIRFANWTPKGI